MGIARQAKGNQAVPSFSVVLMSIIGFDRDDGLAYLFQHAFNPSQVILPPHDHRDSLAGGFAFAVYDPGTSLPQQPLAQ